MEGNWQGGLWGQNKYQYNGKELNQDFGLDWNDYGARFYDAAIGRWTAVDPLAEKTKGHGAYNYVLGNPIRFLDPDGRQAEDHIFRNARGEVVGIIPTPGGNTDRFYTVVPTTTGGGGQATQVTLNIVKNIDPVNSPQWDKFTAQQKSDGLRKAANPINNVNENGTNVGTRIANPNTVAATAPSGVAGVVAGVNNNQNRGGIIGNTGSVGNIDGVSHGSTDPSPNPLDNRLNLVNAPAAAATGVLNALTPGTAATLPLTQLQFNPNLSSTPLTPAQQQQAKQASEPPVQRTLTTPTGAVN